MHIDLTNKAILVTGASRGIGKAIARQLLVSGAQVMAHYHRTPVSFDDLDKEEQGRLFSCQADLADPGQTTRLFDQTLNQFGQLDVLINNAGIALASPLTEADEDFLQKWQATMAVNLQAVALLCRLAVWQWTKSGQPGIIINMASRAAFRGDTADYLAYAASKGGVVALTRSLARAYGKQNIVAFTIAPGFVSTDMAADFIKDYGEDYVKNDIALPELTRPQDLAPLITLLASGLANHATGATFDINAGSYVH